MNNTIDLDFAPNATEAQRPMPFIGTLAGFRRRPFDEAGMRDRLETGIEEARYLAYWQDFFRWLAGETPKFENFFMAPAENYASVGLGLSETFTAANLASGYSLSWPVGEDKLVIEPAKIIITTGDEFPKQGILAALAMALKNPAFKNAEGVKITADDPELRAFAYAAFTAAGITITNRDEILADLNEAGTLAWTNLANEDAFKTAITEFPELKALLEAAPEAPEANEDLDTPAPAAEAASGTKDLSAAIASLAPYIAPEDIKSYEVYNTMATPLAVPDYAAIRAGTYEGPRNDMRASAVIGLLQGEDRQKSMIVGQILMRAIQAAILHTTAPSIAGVPGQESDNDHFEKFLMSKGIEPARAAELTSKLHAPLKAAVDALTGIEYDGRGGKKLPFKVLTDLPDDVKEALFVLVESQHNPVAGVKESFADTRPIVMALLSDDTFLKNAAPIIASDFVPEVGGISERVYKYNFKTDHIQSTPDGGREETASAVDVPAELGQSMIAFYRMLARPEDAIKLADMKRELQHAPFAVNGDTGLRFPHILQEAATAQYASLLVRGIFGVADSLEEGDKAHLEKLIAKVTYAGARTASRILDDYTPPENHDETYRAGLGQIRTMMQVFIDVSDDVLVQADVKKLNASNPKHVAKEVGDALFDIEKIYLAAAIAAGVNPQTLGDNIEKLSKWRQNTEATLASPTFAGMGKGRGRGQDPAPVPGQRPQ